MSVYISDQVYFAYGLEQFLDIPIHFVNIPPITPKYPLPPGLMFGNIFSGWTYTALIATKVIIGHTSTSLFQKRRPSNHALF